MLSRFPNCKVNAIDRWFRARDPKYSSSSNEAALQGPSAYCVTTGRKRGKEKWEGQATDHIDTRCHQVSQPISRTISPMDGVFSASQSFPMRMPATPQPQKPRWVPEPFRRPKPTPCIASVFLNGYSHNPSKPLPRPHLIQTLKFLWASSSNS